MKPIGLSIDWNEAAFLQGAKLLYDTTLKHSPRRFLGWAFIALAQFGVVMAVRQGTVGMLLLGTLLSIYWYFLRWPLRKAALLREFRRSATAGKRLGVVLRDEGIAIDGETVAYDAVQRVLAALQGYVLLIGDGFLFVPDSAFSDAKTRERFSSALIERVGSFERIDI